ncbi:T9SS type B sorting domain-containing protein [Flavobacterium anhuiense]|uniref:T9SS type B sorting domain-containing protein n=1 Tax=Flavobacterium anhuiense TaxID=459526 RepID=UPI003D972994
MEKPTIFKSVKSVFSSIRNVVFDIQKQFEKLVESFDRKQVLQPIFAKVNGNRKAIFGFFLFLCFGFINAQEGTKFSARLTGGNVKVKGDIILIGNTVINKVNNRPYSGNKPPANYVENPANFSPSSPVNGVKYTGDVTNLAALTTEANLDFNGAGNNNDYYVEYIDIDNDNSTFNSTMAKLTIDNSCKNIVFAGLYWSAIYPYERSTNTGAKYEGSLREEDWNTIKFKVPNGQYQTITASKTDTKELIFNGYKKYGNRVEDSFKDSPYVCFKDVTKMLQDLPDANGDYYVANVRAARGKRNGGGAGGWTLVVIYESPSLPSKFISVFDGYVGVDPGNTKDKIVDYSINGFQTLPVGFPVKAKIGVAALEGDNRLEGDNFSIKANSKTAFTILKDDVNPENNFFNASISNGGVTNLARMPKSVNNMGFDIDHLTLQNDVNGVKNAVIPNGETGATLRLSTDGDGYGAFVTTFAVDVIEPKIVLTKVVKGVRRENNTDVEYDLSGQTVNLGQEIRYEIGFTNQGNDNAKDFTITDVLPNNVIFNPATDIFRPLPAGVSEPTYDAATRTLVFKVDNALVVASGGTYAFKFRVRVISDCNELMDACSNLIKNTAVSRYFGDINPTNNGQPYGDGSYSFNTGCIVGDPTSTNFLVGVDQCRFSRDVSLCGSAVLTAALGYGSYAWTDESGKSVGNTRSITVTKAGIYKVQTGDTPDCKGILQTFVVKDHIAGANVNPVSEYANNIVPATGRPETCTRDNIEFPKIFLCGLNDTRFIDTKITSATSIVWQETKDVPPSGFPSSCPFDEATNWANVATGPTYTVNRAGAFRIVVTYGNNCVNTFYFSVFQNPLDPKASKTDITCTSVGSITVTNPPINTGYTYSLDNGAFQASNVFNNVTEGSHRVNIKQAPANGQTSTCPFYVDVTILKEVFSGTMTKTDPLCPGTRGAIRAFANGISGDYRFILKVAGTNTVVTDSGNISFPNYFDFINLAPGSYDVEIYGLKDNCFEKIRDVKILDKELKVSVSTKPLACEDGEIRISATGGTPIAGTPPRYYYSVNGVDAGTNPVIPVTRATLPADGKYNIIVTDDAGCSFTIPTITFEAPVKPTATINQKNVRCYNSKEGEISLTVTPPDSGFAVSYNVNGGAFTTLPTTNLDPGVYKVIVKYTYNGAECFDAEQTITITGPTATLTASGGVAELSGCGPAGHEDQGLVRITNAQGGVQFPAPNPYRYSFDGGKTWGTSNQAYVDPSATPYTLLIKDAADCIFEVKGIVLDPKPAKPTFTVAPAVYNCNGQGTVTVTANTSASTTYTYSYYLGKPDPANPGSYIYALNTNTPANVFKDVPAGDYKIKVEYTLVQVPTFSNLLKEDFGSGPPTTTPGIAAAYCFNDQRVNPPYLCKYPDGTPSRSVEDNAYSVASFFWRPDDPNSNNSGAWFHYKDHTTNPNNLDNVGDPNGRYLLVNVGNAAGKYGILYSKPIVDVIPNQDVIVDFYVGNLLMPSYNSAAPIIRIELVDGTGKVVARDDTGEIAPGFNHPDRKKWVPISLKLNPGDNKNLTFVVRSGSEVFNGNDLVIDDIWVRQLPKSCLSAETLDLKVENGKGFKAEVKGITGVSCSGGSDGGFSIYAENFDTTNGFYYTLNGGATSPTWIKSMVSPVVISGKAAGTYDVRVRYANNATSCNFTIPTTIPTKDPFVVNATASAATCKGATVTATATGGTPAYTITLKDKNSSYTRTFPSDGILTEVPAGTYIISGVDSKTCTDAMDTELVINPASKPQAQVVQNTGLCFDNNTGAKITVNIIGGVGPFTYRVSTDGGTTYGSPSATFNTSSFDYIATAPGNYSFLITDANSCDALAVSQTIGEQLSARSSISGALTCTTGNATIQVTIEGGTSPFKYVVKNKTTNAVLFTSGNITGPTFTYTDVPGTYVFTITDKNGCTAVEEKEIKPTEAVTAQHKVENVTCYNAANGYVDITPLTGVAPFTYQFNGTGTFGTATHYGNLAGSVTGITYSYIVKDNLGCEQGYSFTVFQPEDLVPSASITTSYTCQTGATITASAVGGNGGYTFVLRNTTTNTLVGTNTTGLFENLTTPGSYSVTVTDSKNCTKTITVPGQIVAPNPPAGMTINNSAVTCPTNKATVTITNVVNAAGVAVSTTGLEYRIKAPAAYATTTFQSSNSFAGLDAGVTYTFEVRDANKCVYEKVYEIKALPVISVSVASQSNISCSGSTDGSAVFTVSGLGNNVAYSYVVDSRAAVTGTSPATGTSFNITVPGLGAGNHLFTITNTATSCPATQTVNITAPAAALTKNPEALTHVTCKDKGTATINVVGGWGTYTYVVTTPAASVITQTTSLFTNLDKGNYTYVVTDLNGCSVNGNFTINDKVPPTASIDTTTDLCAGGAGATIRVTPNTAPNYVYSINGGAPQNNGTFTGLIPDTYVVTVTDTSTGCSINLPSQVVASPVEASIGLDKDLDCDPTNPNAIIRVKVKNGYPDYRYRVSTNGSTFTGAYISVGASQTEFTYTTTTGANAATYQFEILDSKNCRTIVTQNISALVTPDFSFDVEDVKCNGAATGTITVTGIPANGTYEYSIDGGPFQPTNVFTGLGKGTYQVTIRNDKKCEKTKPVTVNEPANALKASAVATDLKCGTNNVPQTSTITVTAQDGTPFAGANKYKYYYNGSSTFVYSNTYTTSASGVVNIIVEDANGCTTTTSATVNTLNPPTALAFSAPAITCDPAKLTTDLLVTVTNGVLPLKYEITSTTAAVAPATPVATNVNSNTYTFTGLAPGNYNFRITDKNDCTITGSYEIKDVVKITASNTIEKRVSCNNGNDGQIKFTVSGNVTGGYTYTLTGSLTGTISGETKVGDVITYAGLTAQTYTFVVTNTATKCTANQIVTLDNPDALSIVSAVGTKVYCSKDQTEITVVATGGTTPRYYAVVPSTSPAPTFPTGYNTTGVFTRNTVTDGTLIYNVYVQDKNGCPQTTSVTIIRDAAPTVDPIAVTCFSGSPINITMSGTVFPGSGILYGIDGNYSTNPVKTITAPGTYKLTVRDDNGCTSPAFDLIISDKLLLTVKSDKNITCTPVAPFTTAQAQVTLSASGGNNSYTYGYSTSSTGPFTILPGNVFNTSTAGTYYFNVTSAGCSVSSTVPVDITDPILPLVSAVATGTKCATSNEGTIKISVTSGGVPPFSYTIDNWVTSNTTGYFTDLAGATGTGLVYNYKVRDSKGCIGDGSINVVAPDPVTFDTSVVQIQCDPTATPPGSTLGSITVHSATGGTGQYTYVVTNNFGYHEVYTTTARESHLFPIIDFGIYTIQVFDENSCPAEKKEIIASPPNDMDIDITTKPSTCTAGGSAIVKALASLGSGNYKFGILEYNYAPYTNNYVTPDTAGGNVKTFDNLIPGVTYTFVVHDLTTNCYFLKSASGPISQASTLVGTPAPQNVTCTGQGDGKVTFTVTGYDSTTTSVEYQIFKDQSNVPVSGVMTEPISGTSFTKTYPATGPGTLTPGRYYIVFTEKGGAIDGCKSASTVFEIKESALPLEMTASSIKNANCNALSGIVTAQASKGTAPYLYQIVPDNGPIGFDAANDTQPASNSFDPATNNTNTFYVNSGNYLVWVKDANGCIISDNVAVLLDPTPAIALNIADNCAAEGSFTVNVTQVTAGIAPYYISVNDDDFRLVTLPYAINGLNSGSVKVIIKDANECKDTKNITITPTPTAKATVDQQLACSVSGSVVENANIHVVITNGTLPFRYSVKKGTGAFGAPIALGATDTSFDYPVVAANADSYIFRIIDANNCPIETTAVNVDPIVPINVTPTSTKPLCSGDANGSILLSATGGKGSFTYTLTRTAPTAGAAVSQNVPLFENLIAGDYAYTIKDALGCEIQGTINLGQPTPLADNGPTIQGLKCTTGNAAVSATVILAATPGSGTSPYYYSFNGSDFTTETTYTVEDTGADQHILYVIRDANGCEVPGSVDILKLNPPTNFTFTPGPVITCTTLNTSVTISGVQNGVGTLTYQIISPASAAVDNGTVATFTNLLPDVDYIFQVTDANGCTVQKPYRINNVIKINIIEQSKTPITCLGTTDGKASFFVSGFGTGVGTYHYVLDAPSPVVGGLTSSTINLTGLSAGSHTLTVYDDATNCDMPITFTIAAPTAPLALAPLNVTPKGCTTFGGVTMTASNGWGDYTYTVEQPDGTTLSNKTGVFGNLIQLGGYNVHVVDANNCRIDDSFTLIAPVDPTATIAATSDYCYVNGGNTTTLVVTAASTSTFVVTPFKYSINNGQTWQDSDTFSNLSPGNYTILVMDKFGCKSVAVNTEIKGQLYASANMEKPIYCTGALAADGTIRIKAVGGYAPYRYTVTYNSVTSAPIAFTNATYSDYTVSSSADGLYVFNVYDAHDCPVTTNTVNMVAPTQVTFTATPTPPSCLAPQGNVANGSILVTLDPGNNDTDYTYTIQRTIPVGGVLISQSTPLFTDLIAGTYTVRVISGKQCSNSKPIDIVVPAAVVATATPSAFTCSGTNTTNSTVVTVTATGGAGSGAVSDYVYSENGTNWKTDNKFTVNNDVAQTLTFYAKDANGCIDDVQIPIAAFPKLTAAVASLGERASCDNNGHETIHVEITGGASPANFDYEVYQDGQLLQVATPVGAGSTSFDYVAPTAGHFYQFKIIDKTTLCSITTNAYQVPLYNTAKVIATVSSEVSCNGATNGEITIDVIDYKGTYTYQVWNAGVAVTGVLGPIDSRTDNPFVIPVTVGAGSAYTVVIKEDDYPFCSVTSNTFEITQPPVLDLSGLNPTVKNQNCNTAGAVITIDETQITGGTKGYKYVAVLPAAGVPADGLFKDEKVITIPTTAIAPAFDTWNVYVMDAKGCKAFVPVNISKDPMPAITNVSVVSPCYDVNGYRIDVAATGVAPLEYSLDGKQYQDDAFFIVKDAGDYTVSVRDANKCVITATTAFNIPAPLTLKADVTTDPTCMNADGVVTLTAGGGKTPADYVYTRDNWATVSLTNVFTGLAPGSYRFIVRDVATNCEKPVDVKIETPTLITGIDAKGFAVTCNTYRDGRIEVKLDQSNNNPVYRYSLTAGPELRPLQDSPYFYDLPAGNYVVTVVSGKGCPATAPVTVGEPAAIVVDQPLVTPYACNVGNTAVDATITVPAGSVRGGSNNYIRYQFVRNGVTVQDDNRNVYAESDYLGGTYVVNVFDSVGCQGGYSSVTIDPYVDIARLDLVTTKINCRDDESVKVTAVPTRGTLPTLTYTIEGTNNTVYPVTNSPTGLFAGLKPGTYLIKVTNPVTGCGVEKPYVVDEPNTFRFVATNIKNVTCFTDTNGSVTLTLVDDIQTPTDESGPFTYVLTHESGTSVNGHSNGTSLDLSGLASGKYTITATLDGIPYCPVTTNFTIEGPTAALKITEIHKPISCASNTDGEIVATATGGWIGDYQYKLEGPVAKPYSAENKFTDLPAGAYTVYVMDANGCEDFVKVQLSIPTPITVAISANKTSLACYSDTDAIVTVNTISGGSGNYIYTLHGTLTDGTEMTRAAQQGKVFDGLAAGTYYVTVSDDWTCIGTSNTVTIAQPRKVQATLSLKSRETCDTTPVITLSAEGGTAPYYYSTDGVNFSTVSFTTPQDFNVPKTTAPVTYRYYVRDANGCPAEFVEIPLLPVPELVFDVFEHTNVPCRGGATGSIYVEAKGGLGNYVYTLINAVTNTPITPAPTQVTPGTFTQLPVGQYRVNVNSVDCDKLSEIIDITQPPLDLSAEVTHTDVTCAGYNNGTITLVATGGAIEGNYSYAITPNLQQFFDRPFFENLKPGNYTVRVQKGICHEDYPVTIEDAIPLVVTELVDQRIPEYCYDDKNGVAFVEVEGGKGPYTASIIGNGVTVDFRAPDVDPSTFSFTGLVGGVEYLVVVKDANLCEQDTRFTLPEPVKLNPIAEAGYDCENNQPINYVKVEVDSSIDQTRKDKIVYTLKSNGAAVGPVQTGNPIFKNLPTGTYSVEASLEGCVKESNTVDIEAVQELTMINLTNQSKDINTIVVQGVGGVAPYEYSFNDESFTSSNSYRIYKTGVYKVIVRDKNDCRFEMLVPGTFYDFCMPNYFTPNGDGQNDTIGPDCGALAYKELTFDIYDRYGRVVAKYRVNGKWDGRYHGDELPTGDYWYVLKLNDPKDPREFVGHFTLYR